MQPIEYKSEQELLNWLSSDLQEQKTTLANKMKIKIEDVKESDLILNIGMKDKTKINEKYNHVIDFDFNFERIINYFNIDRNNIEYKINFNKIFFKGDINFINIKFNNEFEFTHSYSKNKIEFVMVKFKKISDFSFSNINDITFHEIRFYDKSFFSNAIFNKISFIGIKFIKTMTMEGAEINDMYFTSIKFLSNAIFYSTIFYERTVFNYVVFNKKVSLKNSCFKNGVILQKIKFNNISNFSEMHIEENIKLYELTINKNTILIFNNLHLNGINSTLSISNCKNIIESIKLKNILLTDLRKIELKNIEVNEIDFKGSVINGGVINTINFKVHKFANRESALLLKQQAYARNNVIDALEYKAKEIEKHKEDLIKDWQKNKDFKTFGDIVSIGLSSIYSDNGQNWIKALAMTIFVTAFCFTVFYMPDVFYIGEIFNEENYVSLYFSSYKNVFYNLIKYLIPTDYDLIKDYTKLYINYSNTPLCDIIIYLAVKIFGVLVYFLGKVLFWYGSVQTVTAFRKFSKGA